MEDNIWYAVTTREGEFGRRSRIPERGTPVLANLNGQLHAIITLETGEMVHYLYDEEDKAAWVSHGAVPRAIAHSSPCLVAFYDKLFLIFLRDGRLDYLEYTDSTAPWKSTSDAQGLWSEPTRLSFLLTDHTFVGTPTPFVIDGHVHTLCKASDPSREIICLRYDYNSAVWWGSLDVSDGRALGGVSATSFGNKAYLGFIENGPADLSHSVYVTSYEDGKWQPQEDVDGQSAADPPQLAYLNGRIHCIFTDDTEARDLRWYSRPVLSYSLSSWMGDIADDALLPHLTIPGTHDSCARSVLPYVRTQDLTVMQQLALGIRFIDLRLRLHDDGFLYCYHGGVPLGYPRVLSFAFVMDQVWTFLSGADESRPPTETVLISINNDDTSAEQHSNPALFYNAVETAIAATPPYPDGTHKWFVDAVTPRLSQVRGRAVLLRRYKGHPAIDSKARQGLDLSRWVNNNPEFTIITSTNVKVHLQDKWKYTQRMALAQLVENKSGHVQQLMERAAGGSPIARSARGEEDDWFINFCSAVGDPAEHGMIAEPKWIAVGARSSQWYGEWVDGINVRTGGYVEQLRSRGTGTGKKRLGIIVLDYPELPGGSDLVARLIEMNF